MQIAHAPLVLVILDGWGHSKNTFYNAIHAARKPVWETLTSRYPNVLLSASGPAVGLPDGQMGNSEVGHMIIGAGRIVDQEFTRINKAIHSGSFFRNPNLVQTLDQTAAGGHALHILGLLSSGGVHGHQEHIHALMDMARARGVKHLFLHAFLDGRDTEPKGAGSFIYSACEKFHQLRIGRFASLIGRYYAMDRDRRWERTRLAYDLISQGKSDYWASNPFTALDMAYARGETDEFISATAITEAGRPPVTVRDGDALIFTNYRADRARQLARAFSKKDFVSFPRERRPRLGTFMSLCAYKANYDFPVAFPPECQENTLGQCISRHGLRQLRIAETEKYAHVTFFLNGRQEQACAGEDRILVPSPHVKTYDRMPQMRATEVARRLNEAVRAGQHEVIICNFANADMVGHSGNFQAAVQAIEVLDHCLGQILATVQQAGGELLITADHGNAEQMCSHTTDTGDSASHGCHTAHTCNPVPFIYAGRPAICSSHQGTLSDIAPTLLHIMGLPRVVQMTGQPLFSIAKQEQLAKAG